LDVVSPLKKLLVCFFIAATKNVRNSSMPTKKKNTLQKLTGNVKKAAKAIADTAGEYVVEPVGKALGLVKKDQKRLSAARRKQLKVAAKKSPRGKMRASR
jgi:hypothetical protein